MPNNDRGSLDLERINARIHGALAAALDVERSPTPGAATRTNASNGTDLPRSANGPGRSQRNRDRGGRHAQLEWRTRATRVEVDPEAWRLLRAQAIRCRLPLSEVVGELVRSAVTGGVPVESAKPDVPPRRSRGLRGRRLHPPPRH